MNTKTREQREYTQWAAWRKAKRGKVSIDRTPLRILDLGDGLKTRMHRACIVVTPTTYNRDQRQAFAHFCKGNDIALVPCEFTDHVPAGLKPEDLKPETRATAYMAYGHPNSLKALTGHKYVGETRWTYVTDAKASGAAGKLAVKPRVKVADDKPPTDAAGLAAAAALMQEVRELTAEWIAENIEEGTEEQLAALRKYLGEWFLRFDEEPESIEELAEFACELE